MTDDQLEARARAFFASWGTTFDGMCAGFESELDPGCDWDQRPMWRTRSRDGALKFLRLARRSLGLATVDVDMLSLAVSGDVVHTARVDHLRRRDGSLIASAAVAGVLTYRDSQVVHWKEYFDPTTFTGRVAVNALRHAVRR